MENKINAKINLKKVVILSLILTVIIFLTKNSVTYFFTGRSGFGFDSPNFKTLFRFISYVFIYYYFYTFFLLSVFTYLRNSLPIEYKKAGLIFALILFLVGSAPYSLYILLPEIFPNTLVFQNNLSVAYTFELISDIVNLIIIGFIISYSFEKFYKKQIV